MDMTAGELEERKLHIPFNRTVPGVVRTGLGTMFSKRNMVLKSPVDENTMALLDHKEKQKQSKRTSLLQKSSDRSTWFPFYRDSE